jgi:hypothetical protein
MGFFSFGKPIWFKNLPDYFKPDESRIKEIENFRTNYGIDNDTFTAMISMTPWSVKKLQWFMLKKFKLEHPTWSEKEIWKSVIISRMNVKLMSVDYPPDFGSFPISKNEINEIKNQAGAIVKDFNNFDDVVKYILNIDYRENRFYDPSRVLDKLNGILDLFISKKSSSLNTDLFMGGDGATKESAIIINAIYTTVGIQAELEYIESLYGEKGRDWELKKQALISENTRSYDLIKITLSNGSQKTIYFDITNFYGKL